MTFDDVIPSVRQEAGTGAVLQGVQLVLHLPHPSPVRRALSRPALLPARRRGAHPQSGGRARHEHRSAGCLQPGVEARARGDGRGGRRPCSTPTRRSASRSRSGCCARPTGHSSCSFPTAGWPACSAHGMLAKIVAVAMRLERFGRSRFAPFRRPASATRDSPLSETLAGLPDGAPRAGDRFPWLRLRLRAERPDRGPVRKARRHAIQSARRSGRPPPADGARRSAIGCASMRSRAMPPTTGARARADSAPSFYLCVLTAMSDLPELTWMPSQRPVTFSSVCILEPSERALSLRRALRVLGRALQAKPRARGMKPRLPDRSTFGYFWPRR